MKTILELHQSGDINVLGEEKEAIYTKGDLVYSESKKSGCKVHGSFIYQDKMKYSVFLENKDNVLDANLYILDEDDLTYL